MRGKPWTAEAQALLERESEHTTNIALVERIERETGRRYSLFTVSRYRAAAGLSRTLARYTICSIRLDIRAQ